MQITCNGQPRELAPGTRLETLLQTCALEPDQVVVELNGEIISPSQVSEHCLQAGDHLELIHFVGGGCCAADWTL